jgi:uncharacterized protein YajQ (UPF0234 family)
VHALADSAPTPRLRGCSFASAALRFAPPLRIPEPAMPSFDIISEVDSHELTNAVDQANRELGTRFDFKGVDAKFELEEQTISQSAPSEFQLKQMNDILRARLIARGIDARCLEFGDVETNLAGARQKITVKQGIERELAKKIQSTMKDAKLKVDSQINGDKLRVTGKKRDDLQAAIALLKGTEYERPLQFDNFRD